MCLALVLMQAANGHDCCAVRTRCHRTVELATAPMVHTNGIYPAGDALDVTGGQASVRPFVLRPQPEQFFDFTTVSVAPRYAGVMDELLHDYCSQV